LAWTICFSLASPLPTSATSSATVNSHSFSFHRYFPVSGRDRKWGLFVTTIGETRIPPHTAYPPSGHPKNYAFDWRQGRVLPDYTLIYISGGRGHFESDGNIHQPIETGNVFLIFPGVWHRYQPDAKTGWHEHWIGFDGDTARNWQKNKFISPAQPVVKINSEDTVLATFTRIIQAVRANRPALQQILAGAAANLIGLIYSAQQTPVLSEHSGSNVIEQAIARMETDLGTTLDMEKLSRDFGVSYSWFRSAFAGHTGLAPHQYLLEMRLLRARNLLVETKLSVKEIARQTGFQDEHYFSRLFRQKMKITPSQWRSRREPN
jgi:AraC-like DNA-binding protein